MSKPKHELKVGDIWGVLKTSETRTITWIYYPRQIMRGFLQYTTNNGEHLRVSLKAFRSWIARNKAKKKRHYDFKTGKAKL